MKKTLSITLLFSLASLCYAQDTAISFSDKKLSVLMKQAKKENKLIFIDCYTSWCWPCKWMDTNVFTNDTVAAYYNATFICLKLDMEKGEGIAVAKQYDVGCYPTYLFIDGSGNLVHRKSSTTLPDAFITVGKTALDPLNSFAYWHGKHASGKETVPEFIRYIQLRQKACLPTKDMIADYENSQAETALSNRDNWTALNALVTNTNSRLFQYMISHRNEFDAHYSPDSVDNIISRLYTDKLLNCIWQDTADTVEYLRVQEEVNMLNMPIGEKIILYAEAERYVSLELWDKFATAAIAYMADDFHDYHASFLNNYAWSFYEHIQDTAQLAIALSWVKQSIVTAPHGYNTDTYAALLYKLGRYAEAKTWAEISIILCKEEGGGYAETEKLLLDIEDKLKK